MCSVLLFLSFIAAGLKMTNKMKQVCWKLINSVCVCVCVCVCVYVCVNNWWLRRQNRIICKQHQTAVQIYSMSECVLPCSSFLFTHSLFVPQLQTKGKSLCPCCALLKNLSSVMKTPQGKVYLSRYDNDHMDKTNSRCGGKLKAIGCNF